MSVSAVAQTPIYSDPERLVPMLPSERADTAAAARGDAKRLSMFGEGDDEPSFWDLLDVINPLQHIPVVNKIYQELTGDKIGVGARLAGGALFGGPLGLVASAVNCAIEEETGADAGGHVLALLRDQPAATPPTAVAQAEPAPNPAAIALTAAPPTQPIITIPEMQASPAPRGAMMFTSDGTLASAPSQGAPTPVAPVVAQTAKAEAAGKPMPLAGPQPARFMPVPARNAATATQNSPALVTVPVSNSGIRSNVPITGRDPVTNGGLGALSVQKAVAAQGMGGQPHPMLPSGEGAKMGGNADWFAAMNQALDKYDRAGSLAAKPVATTITVQ